MKKKCSFSWGKINLGRRDFAEKFLNAPRWIFLHLFVVLQEPSNGPFVLCVRKEQALEIACFNAQSVPEPSSQQLCANIFFKIPCGKSPSSPNAQAMKKWGLCHQRPPLGAHLQRHSVKELLQHSFQRENQSVKKNDIYVLCEEWSLSWQLSSRLRIHPTKALMSRETTPFIWSSDELSNPGTRCKCLVSGSPRLYLSTASKSFHKGTSWLKSFGSLFTAPGASML